MDLKHGDVVAAAKISMVALAWGKGSNGISVMPGEDIENSSPAAPSRKHRPQHGIFAALCALTLRCAPL